jgi:hypothetical protein
MKPSKKQFDIHRCDSCGKPILGKTNTVANSKLGSQTFHADPMDCASAPDQYPGRSSK